MYKISLSKLDEIKDSKLECLVSAKILNGQYVCKLQSSRPLNAEGSWSFRNRPGNWYTISLRLFLNTLLKSTTKVLNCGAVFRLVNISIIFVRFKMRMIDYRIYAFILIRLSSVRSLKMPEIARILSAIIFYFYKQMGSRHWSFD